MKHPWVVVLVILVVWLYYHCGSSNGVSVAALLKSEKKITLPSHRSPAERGRRVRAMNTPSLYKVASDMTNLSNLVYVLIELRFLERRKKLSKRKNRKIITNLPLPLDEAFRVIMEEPRLRGEHAEALDTLNRFMADTGGGDTQDVEFPKLCYVGDFDYLGDSNGGLVYAIGVNPSAKRITVVFRGTASWKDLLVDTRLSMIFPPEFKSVWRDSEVDRVGVHVGFYRYLFGHGGDTKYTRIEGEIEAVLDQYDPERQNNYKLYITGHSLGGALATLFGFFYADNKAKSSPPITVVSVGSPRVGNKAFAIKFRQLENDGKLHHLRIAHDKDPVTSHPFWGVHTGMTMKFYDEKHNRKGRAVHVLYYVAGLGLLLCAGITLSVAYKGTRDPTRDPDDVILGHCIARWRLASGVGNVALPVRNRDGVSVRRFRQIIYVWTVIFGILLAVWCHSKMTSLANHSVVNYSELIGSMEPDLSRQNFEDLFREDFKELSLRTLSTLCRLSWRSRG